MSALDINMQDLQKIIQEGISSINTKVQEQNVIIASQGEKLQKRTDMIAAHGETLKNMLQQVSNNPVKFPAQETLTALEENNRPDEVCACGNILMADAEYCRKCGRKRPDSDPDHNEEPAEAEAQAENVNHQGSCDPSGFSSLEFKRSTTSVDSLSKFTSGSQNVHQSQGFAKSKSFQKIVQAENDADVARAGKEDSRFFRLNHLRDLTRSKRFLFLFAALIIGNAIFTGVVAELATRGAIDIYNQRSQSTWEMPMWVIVVDILFASVFTIEITLRALGEELMFFTGPDRLWNIADLLLVLAAITELVLLAFDVDMGIVRLVRLTRVCRTIRMIRLLKFYRDLRVILVAVGQSLLPLFWATLFLSVILALFAIVFLLACTSYMETVPLEGEMTDSVTTDVVEIIIIHFHSFPQAFLSLFMSVTGGISWWELYRWLSKIHSVLGMLYVVFILFVLLSVLNIITALFVESATQLSQLDKDLVTEKQQQQTKKHIAELREVFIGLDVDKSGTLTLEEFEERADDPQVLAYFQALEIDAMKATDFFKLFDIDGSGELEIDEFVAGCMRIKGGAKAVDIETIMHENQKLMTKFKEFFDRSARGFARIERCVLAMYQHMFAKFTEMDDLLQLGAKRTEIEEI